MKTDHTLTADQLRELVRYEDGQLFWRPGTLGARRNPGPIGTPAGRNGRLQAHVGGVARYVHRLIWLYHHGEWPAGQIDHINGDKHDNRIENLRAATNGENAQNVISAHGSSGYRGVAHDPRRAERPWRARIMRDGRSHSLGYYATPGEAHDAYVAAKRNLHPFWAEGAA